MSLADYEAKRAKYFEAVEKEYEREVARIYKNALDEIRKEMSKVYEKYAVDGILTKAQMTQYNRLASLEKKILEIMKPANKAAVAIVDQLRPEEYGEAFFRTAWAIDAETKLALNWGMLNKDAVIANLDSKFYDYAVAEFGYKASKRIYEAIARGLSIGQSYPEMMKDLRAFVNKEDFEIMRILRTELHNAQEAGTAASYEKANELGVKGRPVWIAAIDDRTRETHAAMDGVVQDEDGMFRGAIGEAPYPGWEGLDAAERINCRCDMIFELADVPYGDIPAGSYDAWKEDHSTWK